MQSGLLAWPGILHAGLRGFGCLQGWESVGDILTVALALHAPAGAEWVGGWVSEQLMKREEARGSKD